MHWEKPEVLDRFDVRLPWNWIYLHYFDAFNALFRIENALRIFVYVVLKNAKKAKWQDLTLTTDDGSSTTISALAKRRRAQDQKFGYLGYAVTAPLMHLTSGELIGLIFHEAYWPHFAAYFPATKEIVKTKLEEIGNIRNALAHFRPIKPDDVEVVKQNANQMLVNVENELHDLIVIFRNIPTNTRDKWYLELRDLRNEHARVELAQSDNGRWIQVLLKFVSPLAKEGQHFDGRWWRVLTVETPRLLRQIPATTANLVFASERSYEMEIPSDRPPTFDKRVELVFSRETLAGEYDEIQAELVHVLEKISEETVLLMDDNLAQGEIVRFGGVFGKQRGERWFAPSDRLRSTSGSDDLPEFWTFVPIPANQVLTETCFYPWMPTPVSPGILHDLQPT